MMNQECKKKKERCKYRWGIGGNWCAKIIRCPDCGKKANPFFECPNNAEVCPYFQPKKWWHIAQWWRHLDYIKWVYGGRF